MLNISVIGAGVMGLSTALKIKELIPGSHVTVISKDVTPNTTGDGSGGLWLPFLCGNTSSAKLAHGSYFTTFIVPPSVLLLYLTSKLEEIGVKILIKEIKSLKDSSLNDSDIIINCTGLGARYMVPDVKVHPIRGQIIKVDAPSITFAVIDKDEDTSRYILPNYQNCVLGGTNQIDDYNTGIDEKDLNTIFNECCSMVPSLTKSRILKHWTGLRPGREEVRLEAEAVNGKLVIHNYGHGGSGMTLFWGCASQVARLLLEHVNQLKRDNYRCKL